METIIANVVTVGSRSNELAFNFEVANMDHLLVAPFDQGWTREVISRAKSALVDIYYRSPAGKRYRSLKEISRAPDLGGLSVDNFSFAKKPIGIDDPSKEVVSKAQRGKEGPLKRSSEGEAKSGPAKKLRVSILKPKSTSKSVKTIKATSKPKKKEPKKTVSEESTQSASLEGWTREVVHRATGSTIDIYYISPTGKKFRSFKDFTRANIPLENVSFEKKALGGNSGLTEVVRHAQIPGKSIEKKKKAAKKVAKPAGKSSSKSNSKDDSQQDSPAPSTSSS
ncbi:Hypothetical protein NTJ_01615 [Nesidiocoris tenuis]|uniref:MBD domain-containing protein n=1 Tax=Nesidiocoris tenuis TaxID=355587 RepID=A0ABN7A9Z5_9HEMI|nr:Hypothetical protein NTJ_01615 [Nesidiocoris tenuis]